MALADVIGTEFDKTQAKTQAEDRLREYHVEQLRLWAREHEAMAKALFEAAKRLEK